ncbi:MAG: porin family protein [Flavobacteriaceae bacterium]|nr:porin family protein [Flavobacteriaceae bacterium]
MKKKLLLFLGAILTINCYSQISFEKGYYINNSSQKIDCLIKNNDWKNNPIDFEYKISENDEIKTVSIKSVKEFGIHNISKYLRKTVKIDRSSEKISELGDDKNPMFKEEQLFLKVLVEGKANLYSYEDGNLRRFFYNIEDSNVEQLIFKSYKTSDDDKGENNRFRQQLWNDLKCPTFKMSKVENLKYKKNSLILFFSQYNKCNNSDFLNYEEKQTRDLFNLTLRTRLNNSSLIIQNSVPSSAGETDFGNKLGLGFGIEAEFILPFNKNKWSIMIEPTYQNFKVEKTADVNYVSGGKLISQVKYNSIEIPVSLRHYFFLNNNSKIFINASYIFDSSSKSSIEFRRADNSSLNSLDIKTRPNLAFGIGYKLNDKYGLEMRYQTGREVLNDYSYWNSDYKTLSIIFGYSIF